MKNLVILSLAFPIFLGCNTILGNGDFEIADADKSSASEDSEKPGDGKADPAGGTGGTDNGTKCSSKFGSAEFGSGCFE